jgi:DNA-binding transcriptional ArsR family regulator
VARAHDHDVTIGPKDHLVLTPSFFVWPHVRVSCEQPGTVAIAFGPRTELARVASIPPPDSLLMLLDVLADETRLRVIRYLASRGPRSTQELSAFVGVSEPTLSGHLRKLEVAGVVTSKRDGYYVLYELNANVSDAVSRALRGYLESAV